MTTIDKLKVLLIAPNLDGKDVGEVEKAFRLTEAMVSKVDYTILTLLKPGVTPLQEQIPGAEVIEWKEPEWLSKFERFRAMMKPTIPFFNHLVKSWTSQALKDGRRFDLAHQLLPTAPRYASALRHFDIPYILGPVGGAISTPESFQEETGAASWFTRLRFLDEVRLKHDPWLRGSYTNADLVLGVAPYMKDVLASVPMSAFEAYLRIGILEMPPFVERQMISGSLKMLHVGRGVRTKGLRDTVRALAHLKDLPGVTLTSAGNGEEIDICRAEAERLGVSDKVTFLGKQPYSEVEKLYQTHDAFVFPSFRESMGAVIYEAMRWGLPIVTVDRGGPGFMADRSCGKIIDVTNPTQMPVDLASAIRLLAEDTEARSSFGKAARDKVEREALWPNKAETMLSFYNRVANR